MSSARRKPILNRLLSRLGAEEFTALEPHLTLVDLPLRKPLQVRNRAIDQVYFLESGFASVVLNDAGTGIEVGLIGREGMTGIALVLGSDRTPLDVFMQNAGTGWQISTKAFRRILDQSAGLRLALLPFAQAFSIQVSYTAVANGRHKLEERLARWLLMAHDRCDSDHLVITHEFLSQMLAVRRAGVTVAIASLAKTKSIKLSRGTITVVDRKMLEHQANGAYGPPEAEFQRLLG
jgi:CRP-like cAMP-binding protein